MKRALAVLLLGLGIVGIATLAGRRGAEERFAEARRSVDADCRALRSQPMYRHAEVCHLDAYGPKALPLYNDAKVHLDHARSALAHGDTRAAESDLARAIAVVDDMQRIATAIADLTSAAVVRDVLAMADAHREIDAARLLRDVRLERARHPFLVESLQHRWFLAHWNELEGQRSRSTADLASALVEDSAAFEEMEKALVERHDVSQCQTIARTHDVGTVLCEKMNDLTKTAARLDAVQHARLSSAPR